MLFAIIPIVALILGLLLWRPADLKEPGKLLFFCGVFVTLLVAAKYTLRLP